MKNDLTQLQQDALDYIKDRSREEPKNFANNVHSLLKKGYLRRKKEGEKDDAFGMVLTEKSR